MKTDPERAWRFALSVPGEAFRHMALRGALGGRALEDPEFAVSRFLMLPATLPRKSELASFLVRSVAGAHPDVAWTSLDEIAKSAGDGDGLLRSFFSGARFSSQEEAFRYLNSVQSESGRIAAMNTYVRQLQESDYLDASAQLALLPPGDVRDSGLVVLVDKLFVDSPVEAARLSRSISDPKARKNAALSIQRYIDVVDSKIAAEVRQIIKEE